MSRQHQDSLWYVHDVPTAVKGTLCVLEKWSERLQEVHKKQEIFSIPDTLVHMDRDTQQSTMDRASNATSQYHVELKVLYVSGQEWLCRPIHERWEQRSNSLGKQRPFLPFPSTPNPSEGHMEKRRQSVYRLGQVCRKNCSQMHFLCSPKSLVKCWIHGKKK